MRLFKTRTLAADACRLSRVTLPNGDAVKPSRETRPGEEFAIKQEFFTRSVRVKALLEKRVGAKLVGDYMEDLTPPAELAKARALREQNKLAAPVFAPGFGRPTKAQRRALEAWQRAAQGSWEAENAGDTDDSAEEDAGGEADPLEEGAR